MTKQERQDLITERDQIRLRMDNARFIDPKDMRRVDAITSLLLTDGETEELKITTERKGSRAGTKGLNSTKPYYRKGKVG